MKVPSPGSYLVSTKRLLQRISVRYYNGKVIYLKTQMAKAIKFKFSTNQNGKLYCDVFTIIAKDNGFKYKYGQTFEIYLGNKLVKRVRLIKAKLVDHKGLTDHVCYMDTGHDKANTINALVKKYNAPVQTLKFHILLLKTTTNLFNPTQQKLSI